MSSFGRARTAALGEQQHVPTIYEVIMDSDDWPSDSIVHALPDGGMPMEFVAQLNTTPLSGLAALGER